MIYKPWGYKEAFLWKYEGIFWSFRSRVPLFILTLVFWCQSTRAQLCCVGSQDWAGISHPSCIPSGSFKWVPPGPNGWNSVPCDKARYLLLASLRCWAGAELSQWVGQDGCKLVSSDIWGRRIALWCRAMSGSLPLPVLISACLIEEVAMAALDCSCIPVWRPNGTVWAADEVRKENCLSVRFRSQEALLCSAFATLMYSSPALPPTPHAQSQTFYSHGYQCHFWNVSFLVNPAFHQLNISDGFSETNPIFKKKRSPQHSLLSSKVFLLP